MWRDAEAGGLPAGPRCLRGPDRGDRRVHLDRGSGHRRRPRRPARPGDPPDVAILPQPGLLQRYAREGAIRPAGRRPGRRRAAPATAPVAAAGHGGRRAVRRLVQGGQQEPRLVQHRCVRAAPAWCRPTTSTTWEVAPRWRRRGTPPFAMAAAPRTPGRVTDLFENLYLRVAGPERYDALAEHRLPWTDGTVQATLAAMADCSSPATWPGALGRPDAPAGRRRPRPCSPPPGAADDRGGRLRPGRGGRRRRRRDAASTSTWSRSPSGGPAAGSSAAVTRRADAARAGGRRAGPLPRPRPRRRGLGRAGRFLSPNEDVDLSAYPDDTTRRIARAAARGGRRLPLRPLRPAARGVRGHHRRRHAGELRAFVADPGDVAGTAARLEGRRGGVGGRRPGRRPDRRHRSTRPWRTSQPWASAAGRCRRPTSASSGTAGWRWSGADTSSSAADQRGRRLVRERPRPAPAGPGSRPAAGRGRRRAARGRRRRARRRW